MTYKTDLVYVWCSRWTCYQDTNSSTNPQQIWW